MEWQDKAYILESKKFGEKAAILVCLTQEHGKWSGLYKKTKNSPYLQPGDLIHARWVSRLEDQLGTWIIDQSHSTLSYVLTSPLKLFCLKSLCQITKEVLADRHPYPNIYEAFQDLITNIKTQVHWLDDYCQYELLLLKELGFELELSRCTVTGQQDTLTFISPKTGRAVSEKAGKPYEHLLLKLPSYLKATGEQSYSHIDFLESLKITGYFLKKHFNYNDASPIREEFFKLLTP